MKEIEKKNWLKLYEIAEKIKKVEPWNELWDTDLFVYIEDDDVENTLYFCTMGKAGIHKSIAVYRGDEINGYIEMNKGKMDSIAAINNQECIKVCYLESNDTLPENKKIIKELGLKYRGTWTSFEKFEYGYEFSKINPDEVIFMIKALEIYYDMFIKYQNENIKVDFENDKCFTRKYDTKTNKTKDVVEDITYIPKEYISVSFDGDIKNLTKRLKKTNMEWELDFLNYLPIRIEDMKQKDGRYAYPIPFIIADKNSKFILDMKLNKKPEDYNMYIDKTLDDLIQFMLKVGKPKKIYVRDERTQCAIKDILKALKIELILSPSLPAVDYAYEMFLNPPSELDYK